ncbi:MAG: hypothetical protein JSW17_00480 [Candidatus Omnitrophota bacterium]|nr:MAG: hypothetical protein JSW17_00480 [Candidatus Omnitrophota bacterium]
MAKAKKKAVKKASKSRFAELKKLWPKTKKEWEKGLKQTKKLLDKGETYLKSVSEKGVEQTRKISLNLKKEQLYYNLGKLVANTPKTKWSKSPKVAKLLKQIANIENTVKKIK